MTSVLELNGRNLSSASPGTQVPAYDRHAVGVGIVHFGVGGFHRAHQAVYLDTLLGIDPAAADYGICGVSLLPNDRRIVEIMTAQDTLYTVLEKAPDDSVRARVVGSILDHRFGPDDPDAVLELLASPAVTIITLTITEGGYHYSPSHDTVDLDDPDLHHDIANPSRPRTVFGYLLEALRRRRLAGVIPFTVLSCDNVHANGDVTRRVLTALAERVDPELAAHVAADVAFPNSMVDRITPRTADDDIAEAERLTGLADGWPVATETFSQWVIEDDFPAGRPAWERVGAELVDDVRPYELMKMRLLNTGHQTISYAARLLGHGYAHEACADPTIARLLHRYQHDEGARTLQAIPDTDFHRYADTVAERFRNPQIRDSITRLSDQSSTSIPNYVLPVIRDLLAAGHDATASIAVVACWARFLEGVDEDGNSYPVSGPGIEELQQRAARHDEDPLAVVTGHPMFAGLDDRPDFTGPYAETLVSLRTLGVRAALDSLLAQR